MTLDASGNLGIGTTSPTARLSVQGSSTNTITVSSVTVDRIADFASNTPISRLIIGGDNATGNSYIQSFRDAGAIIFGTRVAPDNFERMRITAAGNVGIGTSSPGARLTVNGTNPAFDIQNSGSTYFRAELDGSNFTYLSTIGANDMILRTNSSERMRITSGGNVLVGTTTDAGYKLEVAGNIRANGGSLMAAVSGNYLQSTRVTTNAQFQTWYDSDGTTRRGYFGFGSGGSNDFTLMNEVGILILGSNNAERARFNSGGELLINTTSDAGDYKLQVNGNSYVNGKIRLTNDLEYATTGGTVTGIIFGDASNLVFRQQSTAGFQFQSSAGANYMTLNTSGNLELPSGSIKTAAPSGGTAQAWKLGNVMSSTVTENDEYLIVEVNGVQYNLRTCTPN
jgi:hypothetical protein